MPTRPRSLPLVVGLLAAGLLGLLGSGAVAQSNVVILSTTTSTQDSGLLDVLVPMFEKKTGLSVKMISVGTGQALALAARGEADVTLAHAPAQEKKYVADGKMRAIGVTSEQRLPGVNVPTLKEQGIDVVIGNWRGVYGAPGLTAPQRKALTDMVLTAVKSPSWQEAVKKNDWTPAVLTGPEFDKFVDDEFATLRAIMAKSGMV